MDGKFLRTLIDEKLKTPIFDRVPFVASAVRAFVRVFRRRCARSGIRRPDPLGIGKSDRGSAKSALRGLAADVPLGASAARAAIGFLGAVHDMMPAPRHVGADGRRLPTEYAYSTHSMLLQVTGR